MNEKINEILTYSLENMYDLMKQANDNTIDYNMAKIKMAINHSLVENCKTLLQNQMLEKCINYEKMKTNAIAYKEK